MHGPKPENDSPGLGANESRANCEKKSNKRRSNTKSNRTRQALHSFAVTDGSALAGHIIEGVGSGFKATDQNGKTIGIFKSLKEAMAAIPPTAGGGL
jgi:hypothetical protein